MIRKGGLDCVQMMFAENYRRKALLLDEMPLLSVFPLSWAGHFLIVPSAGLILQLHCEELKMGQVGDQRRVKRAPSMTEVLSCLGSRSRGGGALPSGWITWETFLPHSPQGLPSSTFLLDSMFSDKKPISNCFRHVSIGSFLFCCSEGCFPLFLEFRCGFAIGLFGFDLLQAGSASERCLLTMFVHFFCSGFFQCAKFCHPQLLETLWQRH